MAAQKQDVLEPKTHAHKKSDALATLTDLGRDAVTEISRELRQLLADVFALYVKTKNFHWHMSGRHFRDYHLLMDEQAEQIFAMTDDVAERARKIGGTTLHSISDIARHQRLHDNDGLAAQCRVFLLLARRKEGVEVQEQPLHRIIFGR